MGQRLGNAVVAAVLVVTSTGAVGVGARSAWAAASPRFGTPASLQVENVANPLGVATATPRLSWKDPVSVVGAAQTSAQVQVAANLSAVTGSPAFTQSGPSTTFVYPASASALVGGERYYWRVRVQDDAGTWSNWSSIAFWQEGALTDSDWRGAAWIGTSDTSTAAPDFRADITLPTTTANIAWATVTVAGLGLNAVHVNGQTVDQDQLDAAYTDYAKRILYVTHNVAPATLTAGANTLGVVLGSGWYDTQQADTWTTGSQPNGTEDAPWRGPLMFRLLMTVRYSDGSTVVVTSSPTPSGGVDWTTSSSETTWNSPYGGESVDLTRTQPGWDSPGFAPVPAWSQVISENPPPGAVLTPQLMPAIQKAAPVAISAPTNPAVNTYVYTVAANTTGWAKIPLTGARGQVVRVDYDETLNAQGTVSKAMAYKVAGPNPRWQHDEFTLTGGTDVLEPRFTYKGFKYLQISSATALTAPATSAITVYPVHTALTSDGSFSSSDPLLNSIHDNDTRTLLNNLQGIETDCPTREKAGWLADAQLAADTATFNYDSAAFYEKFLGDMRDAQQPSGLIPPFVPTPGAGKDGSYSDAWWGGALISIAWDTYRYDGDVQALQDNYVAMSSYMNYLAGPDISYHYLASTALGDWIAVDGTATQLVSSAAYYMYARIMASTATVLGKPDDATAWTTLAANIRAAINAKWFDATTHTYHDLSAPTATGGHTTQTGLGLVVALGIVPDGELANVGGQLVAQLQTDKGQFTTGIVGTKYLLQALDTIDRNDLAYQLVSNNDGNGYAAMLNAGATTVWEAWNPAGLSQDHPALTSVEGWLYEAIGGIHVDRYSPQRTVTIAPSYVGPLTQAAATMSTPTGTISSRWQVLTSTTASLSLDVPAATSVTVLMPVGTRATPSVQVDGRITVPHVVNGRDVITGVRAGHHNILVSFGSPDLAFKGSVTASSSVDGWGWGAVGLTDGRTDGYLDPTAPQLGFHSKDGDTDQSDTQWVQVDLGATKSIGSITLWPSAPSSDVNPHPTGWGFPVDYRIEVSDTADFSTSTTFATVTGLPNPGAAPQTYAYTGTGTASGRYIRVTATKLGPTRNGYYALSLAELTATSF